MMRIDQIAALFIILAFYIAYFTKMYLQKRRGIRTHQINQGTKPPETKRVEKVMSVATLVIVVAELLSIVLDWQMFVQKPLIITGLMVAAIGVLIFIFAMITMRDSWRAGINESEKTQLVTSGIYRFSRNPAFLGFDLMYIGILMTFFNIPLLVFTVFAVMSLHFQIRREEAFLITVFGAPYEEYMQHTCRYIGRK